MSVSLAIRGWRASVVHASTKRIQCFHRSEPISRPAGLSLPRASSTSTTQAITSEQSTSIEEAKLSQAHGPARDEQTDLPLLAIAEPEQSTKSLSAEEMQVVARMRTENYSRLRIAQFLGRHLQVVHDALYQIGPVVPGRKELPGFRFSDSQLEQVESLRRKGTSWEAIVRLQVVPGITRGAMIHRFDIEMKARGKQSPNSSNQPLVLSAAELQQISELRRIGKTWAQIAELEIKNLPLSQRMLSQRIQRAYARQTSRVWNHRLPEIQFTASELQNITRLRVSKHCTWGQIAEWFYPGWWKFTVSNKFYMKMLEEDADPLCQDPNAAAAARLEEEMKSWLRTMKSKYPMLHLRTVCERVLQDTWKRDGKGAYLDNRSVGFKISAADAQEVSRLREEGKRWHEIAELKYPGWGYNSVREAFAKSHGIDARTKTRSPLHFTAADFLEIDRLQGEGKTWLQISELKYPGRNWENVRAAVVKARELKRLCGGDVEVRPKPSFKASAADHLDVAQLRKSGKSWGEITRLKFPEWSASTVRRIFRDEAP